MDTQPKCRAAAHPERNAQLLCEVLAASERQLRRQALRHAELPEDAQDALQSAFVLFIERFRGDCEPLAWLHTTVKREAWGLGRRASRRREVSLDGLGAHPEDGSPWVEAIPSPGAGPCELAIRAGEIAEGERLLARLKPDERRALLLQGMGLSYREICRVTGWTYRKVNRCIAEGRAALREELASAGG